MYTARSVPFLLAMALTISAAPPATKRTQHADNLHGTNVLDPYRWLESDSPEVTAWVQAQGQYTRSMLDKLPGRDRVKNRLVELNNYTRGFGLVKRAGRIFYQRQDGLQNQPVLYVRESDGAERELLNPNTMSKEGTTALSSWAPSPNGKYLVYGIAKAGSDWEVWQVRDVATGKDLTDKLDWIKFSAPAWSPDSAGIYYTRFPEPAKGAALTEANYYNKLYYHRLGAKQSEDKLLYERNDHKDWMFGASPTDDGRYLLILVSEGTKVENLVYYQDLRNPGKTVELIRDFTGAYSPLGSKDGVVYFQTTEKAPKGRVIAIDLAKPDRTQWKEVIPESKDMLEQVVWSGGHLFCAYLTDVKSAIRIHALDGKFVRDVKLPGMGQVNLTDLKPDEPEQFFQFAGYTTPPTLFRYDMKTGEHKPLFSKPLPFDPSAFETTQVFYPSKDGTKIPMFISHRKGLKLDGANPTLLYGYGGFSVALRPSFSVLYLTWMEMGGVVAVANLRGGSEYGEAWHQAGMLDKKQNVFDDFIAAGEWLIANKYTATKKLAIMGGSNGGLLVGACLNQRPDLFGAAIPAVGVMDMLRFHKFTIGQAWTSDYGSPDDPKAFAVLRKYSPLHNIRKGAQYPPTLIITADHDDRVVPLHSFKYAAELQHSQEGKAPILIRIEPSAGHGAGKPTAKIIEEQTDVLSFLRQSLGMQGQ
jgi:prolyl oligopeptidase